MKGMIRLLTTAVILGTILCSCHSSPDPLAGFPRLMLWAWERPEDLRFLDPQSAGVAFLAGTVAIDNGSASWRGRLQPLRVSPGTKLMAVVRIESRGGPGAEAGLVAKLVSGAVRPGVSGLQIDYDASYSERPFYRDLARAVRAALPPGIPLSMTALVSWCSSDNWIRDMPVAEAVPMYFRMGPETYLRRVAAPSPPCQSSTGLSTDELIPAPVHRRVYLFNPRPWTREALRIAMSEVNRWQ